ncbi:MAG: 23S rRNA (adenine(2030)-N(6))-methyltransferase RlmJ [Parvularculaceae bacterium]
MNYRHSFHAGNFADIFKHAILALCLEHLREKPSPFRVIDTHAGAGRYDLAGVEAGKTLEWADGIGRLVGVDAPPIPAAAAPLLAPFLDIVRAENPDGRLTSYPGSPAIARAMLRAGDRLVVNELHPDEHAALAGHFRGDSQVKVLALDGWTAVKALLPPKERRGLVLIDPPFEDRDDFEKLAQALGEARRRFASGTYLLWRPIKDPASGDAFHARAAESGIEKMLQTELTIRAADPARLTGCAMLIVNPPWTLREKLEVLGPFLAERLAQGPGGAFTLR